MNHFHESIRDFKSEEFRLTLKQQIKSLPAGSLPLEKSLTQGGYVDDHDVDVTVLASRETDNAISVKLGVFFTEIVINCSCGDEPMPINAYCEMQMSCQVEQNLKLPIDACNQNAPGYFGEGMS